MAQMRQLYQLQQRDTLISQKKQRLLDVLNQQKEPLELVTARTRRDAAVADTELWQATHNKLALELGSLNSKVKRSEERLYSGTVKNPKELADLQHEIEALGRRREALEEEILEAMIMLEDAQAELTAATTAVEALESRRAVALQALKQEQDALASELHQLLEQRNALAGRVDAPSLQLYDDLRAKKGGTAVATIRMNSCSVCRITVSASTVKQADRGELAYCGGCGRMLVFP